MEFHPDVTKQLLFGAGDSKGIIHAWDINTGQQKMYLSEHYSKVTSLSFHENGKYLVR